MTIKTVKAWFALTVMPAPLLDDLMRPSDVMPRRWRSLSRHEVSVLADRGRLVAALDAILDNVLREHAQGIGDVFAQAIKTLVSKSVSNGRNEN